MWGWKFTKDQRIIVNLNLNELIILLTDAISWNSQQLYKWEHWGQEEKKRLAKLSC